MNVSLTPELDNFIAEKVASGFYSSASEVIRESLRLLKEQDELRRRRIEELRKDIKKGLDQSDKGEVLSFTSTAEIMAHIKKEGAKRLNGKGRKKL